MTEVVEVTVAVQPVAGAQLAFDCVQRGEEARIVRGDESEFRQQQRSRIEIGPAVARGEGLESGIPRALENAFTDP